MALVTCKDCKKEFSTDAKRCPHCGANKPLNIGGVITLLCLFALAWAYFHPDDKKWGTREVAEDAAQKAKKLAEDEREAEMMQISLGQYETAKNVMMDKGLASCRLLIQNSATWGAEFDGTLRNVSWITDGKTIKIIDKDSKIKGADSVYRYVESICTYSMETRKTILWFVDNLPVGLTLEENGSIHHEETSDISEYMKAQKQKASSKRFPTGGGNSAYPESPSNVPVGSPPEGDSSQYIFKD